MGNIWNIGSWPGIGKKTKKNRQKYIQYALQYGFVGLGSDYLPDISNKSIDKIKILIREKNDKNKTPISIGIRAKRVFDFANISKGDVILLYYKRSAYVGIAKENPDDPSKKPYYFVSDGDKKLNFFKGVFDSEDRVPHRIDVNWQFKEDSKVKLFDRVNLIWRSAVHQVSEMDLDNKIENEKLKNYLKNRLKNKSTE
jgi:hypothetical protein